MILRHRVRYKYDDFSPVISLVLLISTSSATICVHVLIILQQAILSNKLTEAQLGFHEFLVPYCKKFFLMNGAVYKTGEFIPSLPWKSIPCIMEQVIILVHYPRPVWDRYPIRGHAWAPAGDLGLYCSQGRDDTTPRKGGARGH